MRLRSLAPLVAALAVAGLAGCGSSPKPGAKVAADVASTAPSAKPGATATPAAGTSPSPGAASATPGSKPGAVASGAPKGSATPAATPTYGEAKGVVDPDAQGTPEEVPIQGSVTPACVARGGAITLTVVTKPKAQIAFVAIYAGEKSGAAPPWGEGHGGNDQGAADYRGEARFTWIVGLNAPTGPARVMVVVGADSKQRAINVPFSVSEREADGCGT